jgi:hypothetical protein
MPIHAPASYLAETAFPLHIHLAGRCRTKENVRTCVNFRSIPTTWSVALRIVAGYEVSGGRYEVYELRRPL